MWSSLRLSTQIFFEWKWKRVQKNGSMKSLFIEAFVKAGLKRKYWFWQDRSARNRKLDKASFCSSRNGNIPEDTDEICWKRWVENGKLLNDSKIDPSGLKILDLGASTGGFTDCLLQKGAKQATCIDVGHGQLHYKLRSDPRVKNFEKINIRSLQQNDVEDAPYPLVVMDPSFISLQKVLVQSWDFGSRRKARGLGQTSIRMHKERHL